MPVFFLPKCIGILEKQNDAKIYYKRAIEFGEEIGATETGYYLYSLLNLGKLINEEDREQAVEYFETIRRNTKRKHPANKTAKEYLKKKPKRKKEELRIFHILFKGKQIIGLILYPIRLSNGIIKIS